MKYAIATAVALCLAVTAQAELLVYEGVSYDPILNVGNGLYGTDSVELKGITGQRGDEVGLGGNDNPVVPDGWDNYATGYNLRSLEGSLTYPGANSSLPTTGNRISTSVVGSHDRFLENPIGDVNGANTVYFSFLMNPADTVNHFCVLDLRDSTGVTPRRELGGWGGGGAGYRLYPDNPAGYVGAAATANTTYLFVGKIEFTGDSNPDTWTAWLNPTLSAGEAGNTPEFSAAYAGGSYDSLAIYYYQDYGDYDEIKFATTWDDLMTIPGAAPQYHPGDANGDDIVDLQDFGLLKDNYGTTTGATWAMADFNADGAVDLQDFGVLKAHYGHTVGDNPLAAVPEPATMGLLALAGLAVIRRRR